MSSVIAAVKDFAVHTVQTLGYPGISLMMGLNAMCIPIPSEAIMPTGGILAEQGRMSFVGVVASGLVGSTVGHWSAYWIGSKLGKDGLLKYGKYIFFRESELTHAEVWFQKYGLAATFFGRMVPVIQTFISLPAGIYKADFKRFAVYTFCGSLPWIVLWSYIGYALGKHKVTIEKYMHYADYVVLALILIVIARVVISRLRPAKTVD